MMFEQLKLFFAYMVLSYAFFLVSMLSLISIACHLATWELNFKGVFSAAGFAWLIHTFMVWRMGAFDTVFGA